jgi:nitrate/TMAO reductase-like tetraheme cytochrome c subunit
MVSTPIDLGAFAMRRIIWLSVLCGLGFALVAAFQNYHPFFPSGAALAERRSDGSDLKVQSRRQSSDSIAALKAYIALHPSFGQHSTVPNVRVARSADRRNAKSLIAGPRISPAPHDLSGAKTQGSPKSDAQYVVAKGKNANGIKIPSAKEKAKRGQSDDLLVPIDERKSRRSSKAAKGSGAAQKKASLADEDHLKLFVENRYPSASTCGICHPKHYKEWSVSQHAYAQLSPVYLSLNNRINQLTNGSNGDFCLRCHSPVGANLGESPFMSNLDRHPTSREGITCVVCHRVNKAYNKASGRLALVEGGLTDPVFGPVGNKGVKDALSKPDKFRVVTKPKEQGRKIHAEAKLFSSIKTSVFCGTCHDVTLFNGFRLEEAYSEYRVSPAAAKGITCQDCHMGKTQGKPSGYGHGPAAIVGDAATKPRKLTSHLFSGPDSSLVHPGIFPHNQKAAAFKTMREWLQFKHKKGWGTDKFEQNLPKGYKFPKAWASVDDRYDAREILNEQFKLLEFARIKRLELMRNGFLMDRVIVDRSDAGGIAFRVRVRNGTDGHNVPTGFTGERLIWLQVTVKDKAGKVIFRSGDRDPNGDLRDGHSSFVRAGKIGLDKQLFSLQSIFVTQNGRGGEIEHVIPIPFPSFALPRVLPSTSSLVFTGEPATERNHKKGIEPNGERWASYNINASALTGRGPYQVEVKLLAQPVPVNLLIASQKVGFDYGLTPKELGRKLIADTQMLWRRKLVVDVGRSTARPSAKPRQSESDWKTKGLTNEQ